MLRRWELEVAEFGKLRSKNRCSCENFGNLTSLRLSFSNGR